MKPLTPLHWYEGMFLRPVHMQQQDRFHEERLSCALKGLGPFLWGVREIEINEEALAALRVDVPRAEILFPSGQIVQAPDGTSIESRSIETVLPAGGGTLDVYIGIRKIRPNDSNARRPADKSATPVRYVIRGIEVTDLFSGGQPVPVEVLETRAEILFERENHDDYETIRIGRLIHRAASDRPVELSREVFPPCLSIASHAGLRREAEYVADGLLAKGRVLAGARKDRGISLTQYAAADMLLLSVLDVCARYAPLMRHRLSGGVHPFEVYGTMLQVLGELAVLPEEEATFPYVPYDHADPGRCFAAVRKDIQALLTRLLPSDFKEIPLLRSADYFTADLEPSIFEEGAQFLLGVRADCSSDEARTMATMAKVSSKRYLENLRRSALRGVPLSRVDIPPAEIPRRSGHHYFELGRQNAEWENVRRDLSIGVFLGSPAPAEEVNLLVVQRKH